LRSCAVNSLDGLKPRVPERLLRKAVLGLSTDGGESDVFGCVVDEHLGEDVELAERHVLAVVAFDRERAGLHFFC
jgi:hypothetical protein